MAGKSRRVASRQGQLKRKKQTKGPSGIPATPSKVTVPDTDETATLAAGVQEADIDPEALAAAEAAVAPPTSRPATSRASRGQFASQGQGRLRGERPAAYLYVGAEFRRILALTSGVLAALIVLGIAL